VRAVITYGLSWAVTSCSFFVATSAVLITETRPSGERDQCRVALDLTAVRAVITYGLSWAVTSCSFFVATSAVLNTEPRPSGERDQCRVALDLTAVRAVITYGLSWAVTSCSTNGWRILLGIHTCDVAAD